LKIALLSLLVLGIEARARGDFIVTTVGTPTFTPVDFHLFAAPIGTAASGYAEFIQTQQAILPAPDHVLNPILGIGPGAPHSGPYDQEIGQGVSANGYLQSSTFTTSQYSNGSGVFLAFMLLPDEYRISLLDAGGNGYQITASFNVVPEPSSVVMLGIGFLRLVEYGWRRRRGDA
jgi:hypothetical protein